MTRKITLFLLLFLLLPAVVFAQPTFINPTSGIISSPFGWRIHPITGASRFHSGIDIADDYYTPVVASAPGVVTHAGWIDGYGNAVIIEHISIHAPAWGATACLTYGEYKDGISIHAPAWGATVPVYTGLITAVALYFSRTSFSAVLLQAFFVAKSSV